MSDDDRRIFIGGLRFATEESTLEEYFRQWGPLSEVKIVRYPPPDSRSKGYGFISFESQAARDHCVSEGNHTIDGKTIEIRLSDAQKRYGGGGGAGGGYDGSRAVDDAPLDLEDVRFRRLFVGNIDHNWTENVISDYFGHIGIVQECTIKKSAEGKPLGFAFMTFETSKCVDKIQQLRPHTIQGRRVETKRQVAKQNVGKPEAKLEVDRVWIGAPESEKGGKGHIGLGDQHSDEELEKYFSQFGNVKKVQQLMWEDTKKKRGYGFIVYDDFDSVDKVVLTRIHMIKGVKIEVKKAVKDKDRMAANNRGQQGYAMGMNNMGGMMNMGMGNMMNPMNNMGGMGGMQMGGMGFGGPMDGGRGPNGRKRGMERDFPSGKKAKVEIRDPESELMRSIFVGNLNPKSEKADLEEYFAKFGNVATVDLKKQPNSDRNKGFAFVVFSQSSDVDNVMASRPHRLGGTNIDCKRKTPRSEGFVEEKVTKVWIGKPDAEYMIKSYGLDDTTTDEVLREYFGKFGEVTHIHQFIWKDTNKKRGYGYISFAESDIVDKVVLLAIHDIGGIKLQCKKALSKEMQESEQRKRMAMQHNSAINMMGMPMGGMPNMAGGGMNNMGGGMNNMGGGMNNMGGGMNNMGGGMNNMGGGMSNMGGGMNNMGGGNMGGGMNNMGGGMNSMGGGMNMGGGSQQQGMMQGMQSNMQSMINQMQQQSGGNYGNMGSSMQNMMSQMNNSGAGGPTPGNVKEMMSNMSSMMGTMKKESEKKKKEDKGKGDETTEKMMGMMGNMMAMMNNMASLLQTNTPKEAAPVPPPPSQKSSGYNNMQGYGQSQNGSYNANQSTGYGAQQNQGYGADQNSGYGQAGSQQRYDTSNYGYGY